MAMRRALPDDLYERMQALACAPPAERIVFYTAGLTETAPTATGPIGHRRVGLIGLPFPGVELKMVPVGAKYELRLRGIKRHPAIGRRSDQGRVRRGSFTASATPRVVVRGSVQGIIFAGGGEDFKLTTAPSFMSAPCAPMRSPLLAVVQDALVAGQDRPSSGFWPGPICTPAARFRATRSELRGSGRASRGAGLLKRCGCRRQHQDRRRQHIRVARPC